MYFIKTQFNLKPLQPIGKLCELQNSLMNGQPFGSKESLVTQCRVKIAMQKQLIQYPTLIIKQYTINQTKWTDLDQNLPIGPNQTELDLSEPMWTQWTKQTELDRIDQSGMNWTGWTKLDELDRWTKQNKVDRGGLNKTEWTELD